MRGRDVRTTQLRSGIIADEVVKNEKNSQSLKVFGEKSCNKKN
jgi:hypothetical protein